MAAFLGRNLVFEVKAGDPRLLVFAHRADHVERVAVAGIGVGDDRDPDRLDRHPDKANILAKRQQAQIGVAVRPRIAAAGQVDRLEPGLLDKPRRQGVVRAGTIVYPGCPISRRSICRPFIDRSYTQSLPAAILARISQRGRCIGALDLRKSCCENGLSRKQGESRCRQSVARICLALHPLKGGGGGGV